MTIEILTDSMEIHREMLGWGERTKNAHSPKEWLNIVEEFALIKGHEVFNVVSSKVNGIKWVINGKVVAIALSDSYEECDWIANVAHDFIDNINKRKSAIRMEEKMAEKRANKKMKEEENKKHNHMVNADALMASINNLRTRNSELVSQVGKMKGEIKSANDEISELKKMLELATLKIAELEDANQELSIYKEMVEEETKIEK